MDIPNTKKVDRTRERLNLLINRKICALHNIRVLALDLLAVLDELEEQGKNQLPIPWIKKEFKMILEQTL